MSQIKNWNNRDMVVEAAEKSESIAEMMQLLGMRINGGNYRRIKGIADNFNVQLPRVDYKIVNSKIGLKQRTPDKIYFSLGNVIRDGTRLKKRLINDYGYKDTCDVCGMGPVWNGLPIVLQIDHKNGNRFDNRVENLRIICPNCHTQTATYSNNGRRNAYNYCVCGKRISSRSINCSACYDPRRAHKPKIDWLPLDKIVGMIAGSNMTQISRQLGVSDNGLRKFLERSGVNPKTMTRFYKDNSL